MTRFTAAVPMRWSDMDAYGHVNNVQFLTYLEEARIDMIQALAGELAEAGEVAEDPAVSGVLVAQHEIRYLLPLVHRHEPIPIDMWVTSIKGASFTIEYEVHDQQGAVLYARARSLLVPYHFVDARPRRLTPGERAFLRRYEEPAVGIASAAVARG